jgi:hypothetical protein
MYRMMGADGALYGPVSAEQLRRWIQEGRANAETQVMIEGSTDWKPLRSVPEFSMFFATAPPPLGVHPQPLAALGSRKETNSLAVAGLVLGIISCTVGFCCCYGLPFNLLGLIFSIVALMQIQQHPSQYSGKNLAITGLVLSALGLILALLLFLIFGTLSMWGEPGHHGHWL